MFLRILFLFLFLLDTAESITTDSFEVTTADINATSLAYITIWTAWTPCVQVNGSPDTNCVGYKTRTRDHYDHHGKWKQRDTQISNCLRTNDVVNGNYTTWTEWQDCSNNCQGITNRYRSCHNPTPCNGGDDCSVIGVDTLTKNCGPVDGGWATWETWTTCNIPLVNNQTSIYGTGTHSRERYCTNPVNICEGLYCAGSHNETEYCRVTPPCLTNAIFDKLYLYQDTPMVVYSSAKVDVHVETQDICRNTTIYYTWELFRLEITNVTHEYLIMGIEKSSDNHYKIRPDDLDPGLYRLHVKIGYPHDFQHWMDESMYLKIEHPPPNTFIKGGTGRIVGQGNINFDGRSGSYSLKNGPGDPSGLIFSWECLHFISNSIYTLLQFYLNPMFLFNDHLNLQKWYQTNFLLQVKEQVVRINASTLYTHVNQMQNTQGQNARNIYVLYETVYMTNYNFSYTDNSTGFDLYAINNYTNYNYTVNKTLKLSDFFSIKCMDHMTTETNPNLYEAVILPDDNELTRKEFKSFLYEILAANSTFVSDLSNFINLLSESYVTMLSIRNLRNLLPTNSSTASFLYDLDGWLDIVDDIQTDLSTLLTTLDLYENYITVMEKSLILSDYAGMDNFLRLKIAQNVADSNCNYYFLDFLRIVYNILFKIGNIDWVAIETTEVNATDWMIQELITSSKCSNNFNGTSNGYAAMDVSSQAVNDGIGYLIFLRADNEGSIGYFVQYTQTIDGDPPELEIECRLNCMKKTATTSIMSLKAICPSCSLQDMLGATFSWDFKHFPLNTRKAATYPDWENEMLSETNGRKFVMKAGLAQNQGYIVEANILLQSGRISKSVWVVVTDFLPYGGTCTATRNQHFHDQWEVEAHNWKDEGFRSSRDFRVDWKEQLNYRIDQTNSEGSSLLYYGFEELSHIKVKSGLAEENYKVTLEVQIYDIFKDYAACTVIIEHVYPPVENSANSSSISTYIQGANSDITYYYSTGKYKEVVMSAEVAGATVTQLERPVTAIDIKPSDWANIGSQTLSDGEVVQYTFTELWDIYQNPPQEDSADVIKQSLYNFTGILDGVTTVDDTSLESVRQMSTSIGTVINNKDYVINSSASKALEGNRKLLDKFVAITNNDSYPKYEDYIGTSEGVLRVVSHALEGLLPEQSADLPADNDVYNIQRDLEIKEEFVTSNSSTNDTTDMTVMEKSYIASQIALKKQLEAQDTSQDVQTEAPGIFESISTLGNILETLNNLKQLQVYVKKEKISTSLQKLTIPDLMNEGISQDSVNLEFIGTNVNTLDEQRMQVTVFESNPFTWDEKESKYITSDTVMVSIGTDENTAKPTKLKFKNALSIGEDGKTVQVAVPTDPDETVHQTIYYKMYGRNPGDIIIVGLENAESSLNHVVYLKIGSHPTEQDHDAKVNVQSTHWTGDEMFQVTFEAGLFTEVSVVYIGIVITGSNSTRSSRRRRAASLQNTTLVDYTIKAITTGCRVWNNGTQKWDTNSCKTSIETTLNETVCQCTNPPGNSFATTFYVPPNTIDFSSVFSKFDISNSAVLFAVVGVIILFLIICIWTVRQDKKDPQNWAISYLIDNAPSDEYLYMLTVYTGLNRHSGTKSNVQFMVLGEKKTTDIRYLDDEQHQGFGVGSTRRFVMSVSECINNPTYLQIWHDNKGNGNDASWYLNKVILEDIQTGDRYVFLCNEWLSVDHDDGKIQTMIPVTDNKETKRFSFLFNEQTRENATESYLWLSVALRPEHSNFTRVQRLSCCLALLFLTMISNAMFFGQDTESSQLYVGPLKFSTAGIYISFISLVLTIPAIFIITYLFRNSSQLGKSKTISDVQRLTISDSKNRTLPKWCQLVAWILVVAAVVTSGFFLILYSMEWGKSKSEEWLLCFFMSFVESMFIMDPLKIIVLATVFSYLMKIANTKQTTVRYNRDKILAEAKDRAASPITFFIDTLKKKRAPLNTDTVTKLKSERKEVLKAESIFIELILYAVFLSVLYLISFSNRDVKWYFSKEHLEQQLICHSNDNTTLDSVRFGKIKSTEDFYAWLNATLIPYTFPKTSLVATNLPAYDRQFLQDEVNFRLGPIRLRQVRVPEGSCQVLYYDDVSCYDKYSILKEDDTSYCVGWENGPCLSGEAVYNITSAAWKFTSALDIWGAPITGLHTTYGGGGYIADFGINYEISKQVLNDLYKYMWIDRKTRAVFTEFTLYNANENVFVYVSLLCEFPEIGGVLLTPSIHHFRPYQHVGSLGVVVFIGELIIIIGFTIFFVKLVITVYKQKRKFFKELWNVMDFVIVILFFCGFGMYIGRHFMVNQSMDKFHENKYRFVNFGHIALWDGLLNVFIATLIYLTTLRLMRVLNYNSRVTQLASVLSHVARDLFGCFVMFFIVYMAFVCFGYLVFGRHLYTYKTLLVSVTTITNAIIGKNSIDDLFLIAPVLGHFYYFLFVLFVIWIILTMLCATLNIGIMEVRQKALPTPYGILDLTSKFWNQMIGSITMLTPSSHSLSKPRHSWKFSDTIDHEKPKEVDINDLVICDLGQTNINTESNELIEKQSKNSKEMFNPLYMGNHIDKKEV